MLIQHPSMFISSSPSNCQHKLWINCCCCSKVVVVLTKIVVILKLLCSSSCCSPWARRIWISTSNRALSGFIAELSELVDHAVDSGSNVVFAWIKEAGGAEFKGDDDGHTVFNNHFLLIIVRERQRRSGRRNVRSEKEH